METHLLSGASSQDGKWIRETIAYASRTLSPAERNYSQLENEGLAVIFAVRKFHQYMFGRKFVIYSDQSILGP